MIKYLLCNKHSGLYNIITFWIKYSTSSTWDNLRLFSLRRFFLVQKVSICFFDHAVVLSFYFLICAGLQKSALKHSRVRGTIMQSESCIWYPSNFTILRIKSILRCFRNENTTGWKWRQEQFSHSLLLKRACYISHAIFGTEYKAINKKWL